MSKMKRVLSFVLCLVLMVSLFAGMPIIPVADLSTEAEAATSNTNPAGGTEWVCAWHTSMMWLNADSSSNISTAVGVLSTLPQRTFRTRIQTTMGGDVVRLTYSNEYGTAPLNIGEVTIAVGDASNVNKIDTSKMVALSGFTVPAGETYTTGPIDVSSLGLEAMSYVTVSTYVTNMNKHSAGITGGLIGGQTNYLGLSLGGGTYNHTHAANMGGEGLVQPVSLSNSDDTGDYNIIPFLKEIDVQRASLNGVTKPADAYATVIFGDSTVANNIPLLLESKLQASKIDGVSVVWSAVKGNEFILNGQSSVSDDDKNGPAMAESGLNRAYKDALNLPGVKKVIVKLGINDILHPYCTNMQGDFNHYTAAREIIAAYKEFIDLAHAKGIEVYFYELSPWNGYTRNGFLTFDPNVDAVRQQVNAWLAKYGTEYDPIDVDCYTDELNSGVVTLGDNYGSNSFKQSCDLKYKNSPTNTYSQDRHYAYDHAQPFDSFGYIPLDEMNNGNALKSMFTTDGIHYSPAGQSKVANLTPNSIFWKTEDVEVNTEGELVQIHNVYCATNRGAALVDGKEYLIVNDLDYLANSPAGDLSKSQEYTAQTATAKDSNVTGTGEDVNEITTTNVVVQRGTGDRPYIVSASVPGMAKWTVYKSGSSYLWANSQTGRYLAWYYDGNNDKYATGTRDSQPKTSGTKHDWYTFDSIKTDVDGIYEKDDDGSYGSFLMYTGLADKCFTWSDNDGKWMTNGNSMWMSADHRRRTESLVFFNNQGETSIDCRLDIDVQNATGTSTENNVNKSDLVTLQNRSDSFRLFYALEDDLAGTTHYSYAATNTNGNNPVGPFTGYTFGYGQEAFWMSSNTDVATMDVNQVSASSSGTLANSGGLVQMTGNPGETLVTLNFFWKEYDYSQNKTENDSHFFMETCTKEQYEANRANNKADGEKWVQVDNNKYIHTNYHWLKSEVEIKNITEMSGDILVDNNLVDTYELNDVVSGMSSTLEAVKIINPETAAYPEGHWVWSISNNSIGSLTSDGEYATINYNGTSGTATVTATYYGTDNQPVMFDGHQITSSVAITTHEKPLTADIQINGNVDGNGNPVFEDTYANNNSDIGDTIALKAFKTSGNQNFTGYTWTVYGLDGTANDTSVVSVAGSGENAMLTVNGGGTVYVLLDATYNDGGVKHAYDFITVNIGIYEAKSDTVIVDFALPVEVDLSTLCGGRTVDAISAESKGVTENSYYTERQYTQTAIGTENYQASLAESVMTYKPLKINNGSIDTVYYQVVSSAGNAYKCSHVDIIPATAVYYEDSIGSINYTNGKIDGVVTSGSQNGTWNVVGTDMSATAIQSLGNEIYGYDAAYENCTTYSMGAAHKVTVSAINNPNTKYSGTANPGEWPTASFSFTGTGFDIISVSDTDTGVIKVKVEGNGITKNLTVNEYYGYTCSNDTEHPYIAYIWEYSVYGWHLMHHENASAELNNGIPATQSELDAYISEYGQERPTKPENGDTFVTYETNYTWKAATSNNTLYQIPSMKVTDLPYGTYTVTITPTFSSAFDMNKDGHYSFSLDAIRVYGTLRNNTAYVEANEADPYIYNIRSYLLDQNAYKAGEDLTGIAFIDGITEDGTIGDYSAYGPNNEAYLKPGEAIAFKINKSANVASIQVGFKAIDGEVSVNVNGSKTFTTSSATDMYRDITGYVGKDGVVTITNNGSNLVALTTLKITHSVTSVMAAPTVNDGVVLQSKAMVRSVMMASAPVEEAPFEPVVSIDVAEKATVGDEVTVKVSTSDDVAYITVNGEKVENHDANFVWTYTVTAEAEGKMTIEVAAYNADGEAAEAVQTASVNVEAAPVVPDEPDEPEEPSPIASFVAKVVNVVKSIFGKLIGR